MTGSECPFLHYMNIFIIRHPVNPGTLYFWFLLEAVLLIINLILCLVAAMVAPKVRVHTNFKLFCWFLLVEYLVCLFTRSVVLLYQSGLLSSETAAEDNAVIVICSWWRAFLLLQIVTSSAWVAMERVFSVYYIRDYEKNARLWIPALVQGCSISFSSFMSCCYTFEWIPLIPFSAIVLFVALGGLLIYVLNNRITQFLSKSIRHNKPSRVEYSLSVRYQLAENLWIAKMLRNGIITLCATNVVTFVSFISMHIHIFDRETRQLLDCLFNVFVAANGPIITCACIFNNEYAIRILKSMFCEPKVSSIEDEGDLYFGNLVQQWESFFRLWFILETVLILASYTSFLLAVFTLFKVRVHIHFKIFCVFMFFEIVVYFTGRLIIIGYQSELLIVPPSEEYNELIIFSSWFKGYFLIQVLTSSFWVAAEREFSFYYIEDYEKRQRLWIPALIILVAVLFAGFLSSCFTFELYLPMLQIVIISCILAVIGMSMYVNNWRKTLRLNKVLKNRKESNIVYSLSVRYQLEENLWCAKILRNGIITLCSINFFTFIVFICAYSPCFAEETRNFLDCLFNIIVAVNGPILAVGSALYNEPVIKALKSLFRGSRVNVAMADGELYFQQLVHQWEEPFELPCPSAPSCGCGGRKKREAAGDSKCTVPELSDIIINGLRNSSNGSFINGLRNRCCHCQKVEEWPKLHQVVICLTELFL